MIIVEPGATLTEWGAIAIEKLLQTLGNTAYARAAQTGAKLLAFSSDEKLASKPEVIRLLA